MAVGEHPGVMDDIFLYLAVVIGQGIFEGVLQNRVNIGLQLFGPDADGKFRTEIVNVVLGIYLLGEGLGQIPVDGARHPGRRQLGFVAPLAYVGYVIAGNVRRRRHFHIGKLDKFFQILQSVF